VTKLNVDEAMNSAGRYNIRGIPTLLVFKNGQMVEQIVGAVPKEQIIKALERHCAQAAPSQPAQ
jgi:thioredoxin 1